jgi:hypothetical protein
LAFAWFPSGFQNGCVIRRGNRRHFIDMAQAAKAFDSQRHGANLVRARPANQSQGGRFRGVYCVSSNLAQPRQATLFLKMGQPIGPSAAHNAGVMRMATQEIKAKEGADDSDDRLTISPEKVCFVIIKAREFDAKDEVTEADPGSNPTDDFEAEVARAHNERTAEYLLGTPLLGDFLEEGLSKLGYSCEDFEVNRL